MVRQATAILRISHFPHLQEIHIISLEELIKEGVLTKKECESVDFGTDETSVDYAKLYEGRMILLRKAYERSNVYMDSEFRRFQEEEAWWLKDYALFYGSEETLRRYSVERMG